MPVERLPSRASPGIRVARIPREMLGCALALAAIATGCHAGGFGPRHALVIGIDGLRPDALQAAAAPRLHGLAAGGTVCWNALAGGYLRTPTEQPTVSGPGWGTIVTGVWADRHRLLGNNFTPYNPAVAARYPHFFRRLAESAPFATLASIVEWAPIDTALVKPVSAFTAVRQTAIDGDTHDLASKAVALLAQGDPDVLFLHFDAVDYAGHASGFTAANPAYLEAVATVDAGVGRVLDAVDQRVRIAGEEWLVLVTTDHGGRGTAHGGQSLEERTIFLIAHGPGIPAGVSTDSPAHSCIPATVAAYLGIPIDPGWGWDPTIFGYLPPPDYALPGPVIIASPTGMQSVPGGRAELRAVVAGPDLKLQWLHEDRPVPGAHGPVLVLDDIQPSDAGRYVVVAENPGGTARSAPAQLGVVDPDSFDLGTGLRVHLPFDDDFQDDSPFGHHGRPVGRPTLVPGRVGPGAVAFTTLPDGSRVDHVRLGTEVMQAVGTGDFTLAFWTRATGITGDPPFVSNKDWRSGANTGFVVAAQPDGTFKLNLRGADGTRIDAGGGSVADGEWHHVAVSHRRDGDAVLYLDGRPSGRADLSVSPGLLDSGLPLNLGQDGTGRYTDNGRAGIGGGTLDEFALWTRALDEAEVLAVHALGLAGEPLPGRPRLRVDITPDGIVIDWPGAGWRLQERGPDTAGWQEITGRPSPPFLLSPGSGQARFFRLIR